MTAIPLHTSSTASRPEGDVRNPLPQLLQTPSGLALLEMQGTINLPDQDDEDSITSTEIHGGATAQETPIGRLVFPLYDPQDANSTAWMKRVYMYVGKHQRLTGEVKKLPKAIAIIRKRTDGLARQRNGQGGIAEEGEEGGNIDELEIVEIVKYKILFSSRPEPVGAWAGET
jgi:chromosome transmission fidelity protein 8